MKTLYLKLLTMFLTVAVIFGLTAGNANAAEPDWSNNVIEVTGTGAYPARAVNQVQARAMAKRAAIADAYRQLAEAINGVNVDSETTVENMITTSDIIKTKVSACIRGAQIVSEREILGGGYEVTMRVALFGSSNSIAEAVMPRPQIREDFPRPSVQVPNTRGGYTGLIVDCRGLGLKPIMSPVIMNDYGQKIYGHKNLDPDKVIAQGMANYTYSLSSGIDRAGNNPLIIKAVALRKHNSYPVISSADADKVLAENEISHFLDATNVVFVR